MESCVNDIITITQCWFKQHETNKQSKNGSKRYTQWIFITLSKIQGIFYTLKFQNASFTGDKYICLIFFAKYQQHLVDEEWFVFRFVFIFKVLVVFHGLSLKYIYIYIYLYTLGKKGCYTPIEDNKTNVDRTFVFPLGWNWHDMDPWLFPNEIRHYLGQTFNARSSGIVELRNHSIGGRSPKSIFTLWQLWINICIFVQKFFWLFEQCPVQPLWVLGMRCLHLPVRALSKVLLLTVWVWLVLPSTAYSKGMLSLDLWCQASLQGQPERQHLGKTVHCWGWSDRIISWVLGPWRRGWEICTEWGLVAQRLTTDSWPVVTGHIDPQRSPCWLPTTVVSAWSGRRGGGTWQWPTGSMSSSVMSRDSNFTR